MARDQVAAWADGADYLVNSAGIILIKPIFDVTVEEWRKVQTVNAETIFFLCQKVGPRRVSKPRVRAVSTNRAMDLSSAEVK